MTNLIAKIRKLLGIGKKPSPLVRRKWA